MHKVGSGRSERAVPNVSVDPVMTVLSEHNPVTLRVDSILPITKVIGHSNTY